MCPRPPQNTCIAMSLNIERLLKKILYSAPLIWFMLNPFLNHHSADDSVVKTENSRQTCQYPSSHHFYFGWTMKWNIFKHLGELVEHISRNSGLSHGKGSFATPSYNTPEEGSSCPVDWYKKGHGQEPSLNISGINSSAFVYWGLGELQGPYEKRYSPHFS